MGAAFSHYFDSYRGNNRTAEHISQLDRFAAEASAGLRLTLTWHHSDLRSDTLKARADGFLAAFHASHSFADLENAIGIYEEALLLRPVGHEYRAESLTDLGDALYHIYSHHGGDETRATQCIELLREALQLRPPGHLLRDHSLHILARALRSVLFKHRGRLDILMEAASLNREALQLRPTGHPERLKSMGNLANDLVSVVKLTGDMDLQAEMISIRREVLHMCPPGHLLRHISLVSLGNALYTSFEFLGGFELLAEAITVTREAMQLRPVGHPLRFRLLDNLANALSLRHLYEGHSESLSEAITLRREALRLLPDSHPERAMIMSNHADSLLASSHTSGGHESLVEAISLLREAVLLRSPGAYAHDTVLNTLAEALVAKHGKDSETEALSEAVVLHREALQLQSMRHYQRFRSLEGLARVLCKSGSRSWIEALSCYQQALEICPVGSPPRSRLLSGMSKCFLDPNSPSFSLADGISCLSEAYAHTFSHVSVRLKSAVPDLQQLEAAYDASIKGSSTTSLTQEDERILSLYIQVISLLPLAANFGLYNTARLQAVTGCDEIARTAASRAMLLGRVSQAVEMLEQGRSVFWTQTLHLRATTFDGVPEDDSQELQRILRRLEHGARRLESPEQSVDQRERELEQRRQLNEAAQALIAKIRGYQGFNRFLMPPAFDALLGSLPDGFVVILNASKLSHHALLLQRTSGLATSLTLKPFHTGFDFAILRSQLPRDVSGFEHYGEVEMRAMHLKKGRLPEFEDVLSVLWTSIVKPVADALGLHVSSKLMVLYPAHV
jgi:tetratricopeptide (TPR) repeat protein